MESIQTYIQTPLDDFRSDPVAFLSKLARNHGDVVPFRMAGRLFVLVNDPVLIGQVLVVNQDDFGRGPGLLRTRSLLGDGLLTNDDAPTHRAQRRRLAPAFSRDTVASYTPTMADEVAKSVAGWTDAATVDIHREMTRLTLSIVARTLFNYDGIDEVRGEAIAHAVTDALHALYSRLAPTDAATKGTRSAILAQARRVLDEALEPILAGASEHDPLLSLLLNDTKRDEAMTFFLAGHESVSNAISWTCHLLSTHPEVQERLSEPSAPALVPTARTCPPRTGVMRFAQEGEGCPNVGDGARVTREANPRGYLRAVISESLRLYPPAWMLSRRARGAIRLGDFDCPADAIMVTAQCVTHRDARYFADPETFDPGRWLGAAAHPKFAYFPFGAGHRACIGERFAMAELEIVIAGILRQWRLHPVPGARVESLPAVTLRPRYGVPVRLSRR